jgi:hypothetical protein
MGMGIKVGRQTLYESKLSIRKKRCLLLQEGVRADILAYFRNDEEAERFNTFVEQLTKVAAGEE